jgi:hypothetical protein
MSSTVLAEEAVTPPPPMEVKTKASQLATSNDASIDRN